MSINYKFSSEEGDWRAVTIDSNVISVSDLKFLIAENSGLVDDFTRRIDLTIYMYDTGKLVDKDSYLIPANSFIIVKRIPWNQVENIDHIAQSNIVDVEKKNDISEVEVPQFPECFKCKLCKEPLNDPVIPICKSNCGESGCRSCIISNSNNESYCPFCKCELIDIVSNILLIRFLSDLDWNKFNLVQPEYLANYSNQLILPKMKSIKSTSIDHNKYLFLLVQPDNLPLISEMEMILVDKSSNIYSIMCRIDGEKYKIKVIISAFASGGTSIIFLGVVIIVPPLLQKQQDGIEINNFYKNWKCNHNKKTSMILKIEWEMKYREMPLLPSKKQPLKAIVQKLQNQVNIDTQQIANLTGDLLLDKAKFDNLTSIIAEYINMQVKEQIEPKSLSKPVKAPAFPQGLPAPRGVNGSTEEYDKLNPYLGYTSLLPFLTKEQFDKVKRLQLNVISGYNVQEIPNNNSNNKTTEKSYLKPNPNTTESVQSSTIFKKKLLKLMDCGRKVKKYHIDL